MINLKLNVSGNYGEAGQHKMNGWKRWLEGWNSWKQPCTLDRNFGWFKRLKQKDKFGLFSLGILTQKNGIPNFKISNLKIKILGKKIYTLVFIFHKNIDSNFPRGFGMRENFLAFDQYNYIFLPLLITFSAQNNIQKARKIPRWNETLILPRISNAPNVSGLACRFKTLYLQKSHFLTWEKMKFLASKIFFWNSRIDWIWSNLVDTDNFFDLIQILQLLKKKMQKEKLKVLSTHCNRIHFQFAVTFTMAISRTTATEGSSNC